MAAEQGADKLHDVLDSLIEDNILGKPLAASARRFGLTAEETDLAAATELEKTLGVKPDAAQTLSTCRLARPWIRRWKRRRLCGGPSAGGRTGRHGILRQS